MTVTRTPRNARNLNHRPAGLPVSPVTAGASASAAITAAAGPTYEGRQPGVLDFQLTAEQMEVDYFVDNLGWVGFYVQIKAMLGALCPWRIERREGNEWVPSEDPRVNSIIGMIRPPRRSQDGLRFRSLRLQSSIGEHAFWPVTTPGRGLTFDIAHPSQLRKGLSTSTFGVMTRRDANVSTGVGINEFPVERLRRHWIENAKWPDEADVPLAGIRPEMRVYESVARNLQRSSDSRLLMNNLLWISTDDGTEGGEAWIDEAPNGIDDATPATPAGGGLDELIREFSRFGARAFRDHRGNDVASRLPFPFPHHTKPEMIELGHGVDKNTLETLGEIVFAGARGLNIPTQFLVSGEGSANHWNDAELRRALHERAVFPELAANNDFWTEYALRPLLALSRSGLDALADDSPDEFRLGSDTSVLDIKSDSLAHILAAGEKGIASREWMAQKLGVPEGEMLEKPVDVTDYEHWIYSQAAGPRAVGEVDQDAAGMKAMNAPAEPVTAGALALLGI